MVTDSIANASIPMPASSKDFAKKKRGNRTAKLKQCKLDARREQWLSQVKKKEGKEDENGNGGVCRQSMHVHNERRRAMENLEMNPRGRQNEEVVHHYSDLESPSNSPGSHSSSMLSSHISGTNFTGSSGSSSSCSSGSCSGSVTGDDEDANDDGCLDDWEAVADALAASDDKQDKLKPLLSIENSESVAQLDSNQELMNQAVTLPKPKKEHVKNQHWAPPNNRAWKTDDAFRPQSLPRLSKQCSFPSGRQHGCRGGVWTCKNVVSAPSSCPICCEDFDFTDSSFFPCACGFRLCLFCHKRILEEDGRCPGCRKSYDNEPVKVEAAIDGGSLTFRLERSCSMITRF